MVYPHRKIVLDPATDQKVIDRIAHSKVCPHWSIPENVCECWNYPKDNKTHDPKTCEEGNDGGRCYECALTLYEQSHDL